MISDGNKATKTNCVQAKNDEEEGPGETEAEIHSEADGSVCASSPFRTGFRRMSLPGDDSSPATDWIHEQNANESNGRERQNSLLLRCAIAWILLAQVCSGLDADSAQVLMQILLPLA